MTPAGRTNQLLYQAELLLTQPPAAADEHGDARRRALEEGALVTLELALNSLLREVTEHARLPHHDWRALLGADAAPVAELAQLRALAEAPDSWLARLLARLEALHGVEGAARREASSQLIAVSAGVPLAQELAGCLKAFKALLPALRETSQEW
ncbi:DUF6586 family protein [Halomonas sp. 328]|uniref:DUF6586 family protein n=1 Tax=Halomonas sp. 328 TaxID=2776704 RepID=UPI0018A6D570|nr:DUF6586 family protein [Halomonas sp. 328]MBF8221301.1 hypothetical protein [Halomonas sp. 328]